MTHVKFAEIQSWKRDSFVASLSSPASSAIRMSGTPCRSKNGVAGYSSPLNRAGAELVAANWSRTLRSYNGPLAVHTNEQGGMPHPSHRRKSTVKEYVSDIIFAGAIHNRQLTRYCVILKGCVMFLRLLYRVRGWQRARRRAKQSTGLQRRESQVEHDWALKQTRLASLKRESGLEAAAVGQARLKRLKAAQRLQSDLQGNNSAGNSAAHGEPAPPARSADSWASEQAVLRAGLPPQCDWDTLHTRTVTALGGPSTCPISLHLATAYLVSMPYAWERESGAVASLADVQGWLSAGTPVAGTFSGWGEQECGGDSRCARESGGTGGASSSSWVVYEPYFVLRWIPLSTSTAGAPLALTQPVDVVVTLTQVEGMAACGHGIGVGMGGTTGGNAPPDWPCAHTGPDVASLCAEASRAYTSRYGDFRAAWAAWWAATQPAPAPVTTSSSASADSGATAEELYCALEEAERGYGWSRLQSCEAEAACCLPGAIGSPLPPAAAAWGALHSAAAAAAAHMASPDMVSPGAVARAAARVRTQLDSDSLSAPSPPARAVAYIQDALPSPPASPPFPTRTPPPSQQQEQQHVGQGAEEGTPLLLPPQSSSKAASASGAHPSGGERPSTQEAAAAAQHAPPSSPSSSSWGLAWVRKAGWTGMLAALAGLAWRGGTKRARDSSSRRGAAGLTGGEPPAALHSRPAQELNTEGGRAAKRRKTGPLV